MVNNGKIACLKRIKMKLHTGVVHKTALKAFENLEQKFREVHGDTYDYSDVLYKNNNTKIDIKCYIHGTFKQTPSNHVNMKQGCPGCGDLKRVEKHTKTNECFINEAKTIHGDKYEYTYTNYIKCNIKVDIICKEHGLFKQNPFDHLHGNGCKLCANEEVSKLNRKTLSEFICDAEEIHGKLYDYSEVVYKPGEKIDIICKKHGMFKQAAASHLEGRGCPECAKNKNNYQKYKGCKTILYYVKINNLYKVGLTKSSIQSRFKNEIQNGIKIVTIKVEIFQDGWEAFKKEQRILKETKHLMVTKDESPISVGWTEVRKVDILEFLQ